MEAPVTTAALTPMEQAHGKLPLLLAGDIIFIRHKKSFFRYFLRQVTDSYWDHTTMVLYPGEPEGRTFSVIVESMRRGLSSALASRGVSLHKLDKYLRDTSLYDVGIKRMTNLTDQDRSHVRKYMLMNVDAPYWPWKPFDIMLATYSKRWTEKLLKHQRFSCSSLIQKAYFEAMPWDRKHEVVFKEGTWSPIELQELTSPGDIARSPNGEWVYNQH